VDRNHYVVPAVVFLIGVGIVRILLSYSVTAQAFDEPCHVAAAIELLDKGTYTLWPLPSNCWIRALILSIPFTLR
jgi:hypothetical protein